MLSTPEIFLKSYLWKNIDISINRAENIYIYKNAYQDPDWINIFKNFSYMFDDISILTNYIIILSNINENNLRKFLVFYMINCNNYNVHDLKKNKLHLENIEMLKDFIGNSEEKFRMFIISMHFYF